MSAQTKIDLAAVKQHSEAIYPRISELRQDIHRHPELGGEEFRTSSLIMQTLQSFGISCRQVEGSTAVIAEIVGQPGPQLVAVRADIDALPVQEESGVEYASLIPGKMHACGHDFNTCNLLGTAYVLQQLRSSFSGTVRLLFQPAEEIFGGTQDLIAAGAMEGVQALIAAHVSCKYPLGSIAVKAGHINMASASFNITLRGRGGHGAAPHRSDDLVLAAANLILKIKQIAGVKTNHVEPAAAIITQIHAGTKNNILPEQLTLGGTVRAKDFATIGLYQAEFKKLLQALELTDNIPGSLEFTYGCQAVYNTPELVEELKAAAAPLVEGVVDIPLPTNGSENFSDLSVLCPSVYFHIGSVLPQDIGCFNNHSSCFRVLNEGFKYGIPVMASAVLQILHSRR